MTLSGSTNYNLTRDQIIRRSFETVGVINPFDTLRNEDIGFANDMLNMMVKSWESDGIYLWAEAEATVFLNIGQTKYSFGTGTTDRAANDFAKVQITLVAANNGDGIVTVNSINGFNGYTMAVNDFIGIQLDNGNLQWTTITAINTSTLVVSLHDNLTNSAQIGNVVYVYRTVITKPLLITDARLRNINNSDRRVETYSRHDYLELPNKFNNGTVTRIYYQPQILTGDLYLYQPSNTVQDNLMISYFVAIQDFDNSTDNPDLPQEWLLTLVYNLAALLCPSYGKDQKLLQTIQPLADRLYDNLRSWSHDHSYVLTHPNFNGDY